MYKHFKLCLSTLKKSKWENICTLQTCSNFAVCSFYFILHVSIYNINNNNYNNNNSNNNNNNCIKYCLL